jgi:magnesium chelatase family protein
LVQSRALLGLEAAPVTVEVHLANGLPNFMLVGLADTEVKEARERVRSALLNSGLDFPHNKRIKCSQATFCIVRGRYSNCEPRHLERRDPRLSD